MLAEVSYVVVCIFWSFHGCRICCLRQPWKYYENTNGEKVRTLLIARNLGHETPRAITRGNLKTDRDAGVYRDLYGHSRKMANISLRLKENKNVQLNHNSLLYYGTNYVKITTK